MATVDPWELARALVIRQGLSYADAAQQAGVSLSTLEKRAVREGWQQERVSKATYQNRLFAMKERMLTRLENALGDKDSDLNQLAQLTHAWNSAERAFPEHRYNAAADPKARLQVAGEVIQSLPTYLSKAGERELLARLAPHIEPWARHVEAQIVAA